MAGEITSLEFTYSADRADGCPAARYTLADMLAFVGAERLEELFDDLCAAAEQLTMARARARPTHRARLSVVSGKHSAWDAL